MQERGQPGSPDLWQLANYIHRRMSLSAMVAAFERECGCLISLDDMSDALECFGFYDLPPDYGVPEPRCSTVTVTPAASCARHARLNHEPPLRQAEVSPRLLAGAASTVSRPSLR